MTANFFTYVAKVTNRSTTLGQPTTPVVLATSTHKLACSLASRAFHWLQFVRGESLETRLLYMLL